MGLPRCGPQIDDALAHRCDHDQSYLLTTAERPQYDGYLRREETNAAIPARAKQCNKP